MDEVVRKHVIEFATDIRGIFEGGNQPGKTDNDRVGDHSCDHEPLS